MRKVLLGSLLAFAVSANASGVPTVDAANIAQNLSQHMEKLAKYKEQYDKLNEQLGKLKDIKDKLSGSVTFDDLQGLINDLPADLIDAVDFMNEGNAGGLKDKVEEIINKKLGEAKEIYSNTDTLNNQLRQAQLKRVAKSEIYVDTISKEIGVAVKNIKKLENRLASATTAKQTADIQTKIVSQTAILQALSVQGDLLRQKIKAKNEQETIQNKARKIKIDEAAMAKFRDK